MPGQELVLALVLDEEQVRVELLALPGGRGELLLGVPEELVAARLVLHPVLGANCQDGRAKHPKQSVLFQSFARKEVEKGITQTHQIKARPL